MIYTYLPILQQYLPFKVLLTGVKNTVNYIFVFTKLSIFLAVSALLGRELICT